VARNAQFNISGEPFDNEAITGVNRGRVERFDSDSSEAVCRIGSDDNDVARTDDDFFPIDRHCSLARAYDARFGIGMPRQSRASSWREAASQ
jgi:hypothetical protein